MDGRQKRSSKDVIASATERVHVIVLHHEHAIATPSSGIWNTCCIYLVSLSFSSSTTPVTITNPEKIPPCIQSVYQMLNSPTLLRAYTLTDQTQLVQLPVMVGGLAPTSSPAFLLRTLLKNSINTVAACAAMRRSQLPSVSQYQRLRHSCLN